MALWQPSHDLDLGHAPTVWLLTIGATAAGAYAAPTLGWPHGRESAGALIVGLACSLAALGWPDWLSQGLRRYRGDPDVNDEDAARARLIIWALLAFGFAWLTAARHHMA